MSKVLASTIALCVLTGAAAAQLADHHNLPPDMPDPFTAPVTRQPGSFNTGTNCVEPDPPMADPVSLGVIGKTADDEYIRYFDEANAYLMCVERAKFAYVEIIREHSEAYQTIRGQR